MKRSNLTSKEDRLESSTQDSVGGTEIGNQEVLLLPCMREDLIGRCLGRIYEGTGKVLTSEIQKERGKMT